MPKETKTPTTQTSTRTATPARPAPVRANQVGAEALIQRAMADPTSLTAQDVVQLQRHLGNHAVQGLLSRPGTAAAALQRAPAPPATAAAEAELESELPEAQVAEASGGSPDTAHATPPPDDDPLQRKATGAMGLEGGPIEAALEGRLQRARSGGQALPTPVRARMEGAFHTDFSSVKIHTDAESHTLNRALGARAFTTGPDIFFKAGEFEPAASEGQELLAHELTHVVQQGGALRRKSNFIGAGPTKLGDEGIQRAGEDREPELAPTENGVVAPTESVTPPENVPPTEEVEPPVDEVETETTEGEVDETETEDETDTELESEDENESGEETETEDEAETGPDTDTEPETPTPSPVRVTVQIPAYPPVLTERDWDKNKGLAAKLGKDTIGIQLGIVASAHRGVVWNRFDIGRFPPDAAPGMKASETASQTARTALAAHEKAKLAAKAGTPAALRAASRALDAAKDALNQAQEAAKGAVEEAEGALKSAQNEYRRNVVLLLGQLQMLNNLLLPKAGKAGHISQMVTALNAYKNQVAAVQTAYQAFEAALHHAQDLEAEAKQALAALVKGEEDGEDETDAEALVTPPVTDEVESPEMEGPENEPETEPNENAPVTNEPESQVTAPQEDVTETEDLDDEPPTTSLTAPTVKSTPLPTLGPRTARGASPTVTIPTFPALFNERDWDKNKGLAAKLGKDMIGIQLGIVNSAHRGVLWNRFDLRRFPPQSTPTARDSEAAADEARTALGRPSSPRAVNEARTALTRAQDTAKAAAEEAEAALGSAQAEFKKNVVLLLGQLQMLHNALMAMAAKSKSDYVTRMAAAAPAYSGQIAGVQASFAAFEQARDYARALEAEAKQALEALTQAEEDEGDPFGLSTTEDEPDEGNENAPVRKPVRELLGGKFFAELDRVRFYKEPDVQQWLTSPDLTVSAKDNTTRNGQLASLQTKGKFSLLAFKDSAVALKMMRDQTLPPNVAAQKIGTLVARASGAYGERAGFVGVHRQWKRQQLSLAGSAGKFEEWAAKYAKAAGLQERVGEVLLSDQDAVDGMGQEAAQLRR